MYRSCLLPLGGLCFLFSCTILPAARRKEPSLDCLSSYGLNLQIKGVQYILDMRLSNDTISLTRKVMERKVGGVRVLDLDDYSLAGKWHYIRLRCVSGWGATVHLQKFLAFVEKERRWITDAQDCSLRTAEPQFDVVSICDWRAKCHGRSVLVKTQ
jgi:hypothetical protein